MIYILNQLKQLSGHIELQIFSRFFFLRCKIHYWFTSGMTWKIEFSETVVCHTAITGLYFWMIVELRIIETIFRWSLFFDSSLRWISSKFYDDKNVRDIQKSYIPTRLSSWFKLSYWFLFELFFPDASLLENIQ